MFFCVFLCCGGTLVTLAHLGQGNMLCYVMLYYHSSEMNWQYWSVMMCCAVLPTRWLAISKRYEYEIICYAVLRYAMLWYAILITWIEALWCVNGIVARAQCRTAVHILRVFLQACRAGIIMFFCIALQKSIKCHNPRCAILYCFAAMPFSRGWRPLCAGVHGRRAGRETEAGAGDANSVQNRHELCQTGA